MNLFEKKTKIIATLGPSSASEEQIRSLINSGLNIVRINASHQSKPEEVKSIVDTVRDVAKELGKHIGIFLDLQGPKIRVGKIKDNKAVLKSGEKFKLYETDILGDETKASVSFDGFLQDVQLDDSVFIDDGKVKLRVNAKMDDYVECIIEQGGDISNHKGVNLPNTSLGNSAITEKDLEDAKLAVINDLDYIALSFVSEANDVQILRDYLKELGGETIKIIAKIERQLAVDNIEKIVELSDAIMVARGDLGVEIGVENVPRVQKRIITESIAQLKPVIVATQMLESMIKSLTATRAEVSDVANAIYDRCDAVMLSGETAIGIDPSNVIQTMRRIIVATDEHMGELKRKNNFIDHFVNEDRATSICRAADQIAIENRATAVMAFTSSGNTPLIASRLNAIYPIISPTDEPDVLGRMSLYRGVFPMMMPKKFKEIYRWTDMIRLAVSEAKRLKYLKKGDRIVVTAGIPIGESNGINSIRVIDI
jgi:pyruvate kinase